MERRLERDPAPQTCGKRLYGKVYGKPVYGKACGKPVYGKVCGKPVYFTPETW
jgi:hypothetical protein